MKIRAELIQASNNLSTSVPIYTFKITYPRQNTLLDLFGLSQCFERWLKVSYYATSVSWRDILRRAQRGRDEASSRTYSVLALQVHNSIAFTKKAFAAVNGNGRFSGADIQTGIDLFGPNLQNVLKQYRPGELHAPFATGLVHTIEGHSYQAVDGGHIDAGIRYTDWKPVR